MTLREPREYYKKQRETLSDKYIINLLTLGGRFTKEEVSPAMIEERRKQVLQKRANRENEETGLIYPYSF